MICSHQSICNLILNGDLIEFFDYKPKTVEEFQERIVFGDKSISDYVGPCSVDLTLNNNFMIETNGRGVIDPYAPNDAFYQQRAEWLEIPPGGFVLASTLEIVNIPLFLKGHISLKSSIARAGLEHSLAGFIDPGYRGRITLELHNNLKHHSIKIQAGKPIVQIEFIGLDDSTMKSYHDCGQYYGDLTTASNKGAK